MSGECDRCGDHALECECARNIELPKVKAEWFGTARCMTSDGRNVNMAEELNRIGDYDRYRKRIGRWPSYSRNLLHQMQRSIRISGRRRGMGHNNEGIVYRLSTICPIQ